MSSLAGVIQSIFVSIVRFIWQFLGGADELLYAFIAFICIAYVTELLCAIVEKKLSNEIGIYGIVRKLFIFLIIGAANIVDSLLGIEGIVRTITITFFMCSEGMSILENARRVNLSVPHKLKDLLALFHNNRNSKNCDKN